MAKKKSRKPVMLVVASKVKALAKADGMRIGADALAALSGKVVELLDNAAANATADRRQTIKERDVDVIKLVAE